MLFIMIVIHREPLSVLVVPKRVTVRIAGLLHLKQPFFVKALAIGGELCYTTIKNTL